MKQLIHNGILVTKYEPKGFSIKFKGKTIKLTPEQEEMAIAWVKKLDTEYVKDPVFVENFFKDFCAALKVNGTKDDFDFSEIQRYVNEEKAKKEAMTKEEKKALAEERKKIREANKQKYGKAIVDGVEVELGNYVAEPSSIFMGRGQHPLRGRWKEGPKEEDIILNLSPDAPRPPGKWKQIVWEPDYMWVAKWDDKLRGKEKYVWLSDSSFVKQNREIEKFNKALELGKKYDLIKKHIIEGLDAKDEKIRKIATVCYLIDALSLRVGDEKDEDEADTVGATTLTKDNIKIKENNLVEFDFLGKDSVKWEKKIVLPDNVVRNLKEFMEKSKDIVFEGIRSENVNEFLSSIVPGISAKVFRTYHATKAVDEYLKKAKVDKDDMDEYKKYTATLANLQAAIVCNHKRKLPAKWKESLEKKLESLEKLKDKKTELKKDKKRKSVEKRLQKIDEKIKKANLKIELMKNTKDYNLNTSLKSYIDPRVYYKWCEKVGFDWKKFYSKTLQKKFSWVEKSG